MSAVRSYKIQSALIREIENLLHEQQQLSSLLKTVFLALIEEVRLGAAQVDNLWATITIFLHLCAFSAIKRIRNTSTTANNTTASVRSIIAFVANANKHCGPHKAVTDHTLALAFFAQPPDGDPRLLATEDQVRMVLCHPLYEPKLLRSTMQSACTPGVRSHSVGGRGVRKRLMLASSRGWSESQIEAFGHSPTNLNSKKREYTRSHNFRGRR